MTLSESESITILGDTSLYITPVAAAGFTLKTETVEGGTRYYVPEILPFKVGTTEYSDWPTAFKAANYDSPLTLQKDATVTTTVSGTGSRIKINLNGNTLTLNNAQIQTSNQSGGASEIVNGTIVSNGGKAIWNVWNKKGFIFNNVTIKTPGQVLSDTAWGDGLHQFNNCNIECGSLDLSGNASTTKITNCTINSSGAVSTNATITGTNSITGSSVILSGSVGGTTTVKGTLSVTVQMNATVAATVSVEAPKITISNTAGISTGSYCAAVLG